MFIVNARFHFWAAIINTHHSSASTGNYLAQSETYLASWHELIL